MPSFPKIAMRRLTWCSHRGYRSRHGVFGYKPNDRPPEQPTDAVQSKRAANCNLFRLVTAYRENGHLQASINPVSLCAKPTITSLMLDTYRLSGEHKVNVEGIVNIKKDEATVSEIGAFLNNAYCGNLTSDLSYLPAEKREWIANEIEISSCQQLNDDEKISMAQVLAKSQVTDKFLGTKFPTLKRYGLEGAEGTLSFFMALLNDPLNVKSYVLGMTHRGRINLLTVLLNVPPSLVFKKIKGGAEMSVDSPHWTGDVVSHLTCSSDVSGVQVTMIPNPSHLELANPVSMGKTRAKQMNAGTGPYATGQSLECPVVNVQVHGDAAFAGQGVNQETLAMCNVPHFTIGGSVHLVVNNQLGFTTPGERGRSSRYSSDLAKTILAPVLHVNGDDPEAVYKAGKIALKFQQHFHEDIFVEMHCYRRHGHNELDDPTITNPQLYKLIKDRQTMPDSYKEKLKRQGTISDEEIRKWDEEYHAYLNTEFKKDSVVLESPFRKRWQGMTHPRHAISKWNTGLDESLLRYIGVRSVSYPQPFQIHGQLFKSHISNRRKMMEENLRIDWSTAESLAFGSLLLQDINVRLCGQDVGRGTFSHRHVMLVDQENGEMHIPLNSLNERQAHLEIANSILSEEAVLAFEYGFSIEAPNTLCIWEAQFGDFVNGAQVIIDTFINSGDAKWARSSGITLLLPHGYDGAGPEHSSCRLERFLQLTTSSEVAIDGDDVNMQVAFPTTPAQYFHLLRRQALRDYMVPLVVATPKTLLRMSEATSTLNELGKDTHFHSVLCDGNPSASLMVFTTGKHYYTLNSVRPDNAVIVRLESLCPFPAAELQEIVKAHPKVTEFVWSQEEPRNMGAWSFIRPRFENLVGVRPNYSGRPILAAPAYGTPEMHKTSIDYVIKDTFGKQT